MRNGRRFTTVLAFCAFLFAGVVLCAGNSQPTGFKVRGIQVATIQSDEISVPAEFRVALYENLTSIDRSSPFCRNCLVCSDRPPAAWQEPAPNE